jgi:hypothetical protein
MWGYVKEQMFMPRLLLNIDEFKLRIVAAIKIIDTNLLEILWDELD